MRMIHLVILLALLTIEVFPQSAYAFDVGAELFQFGYMLSDGPSTKRDFVGRFHIGDTLNGIEDSGFSYGVEGAIRSRPLLGMTNSAIRYRGIDFMFTTQYWLSTHICVFAKAGLANEKFSYSRTYPASIQISTVNTVQFNPEFKVGARYKVNDNFSIDGSIVKTYRDDNFKWNSTIPYQFLIVSSKASPSVGFSWHF